MKKTPATALVFEALRELDDFCSTRRLEKQTGEPRNRVSAALYHLEKYHAVCRIVEAGETFWYATPDTDTRLYQRAIMTVEETPRLRRGRRHTVIGPRLGVQLKRQLESHHG